MKKFVCGIAVLGLLSGCLPVDPVGPNRSITDMANDVIDGAYTVCNYAPHISWVVAILGGSSAPSTNALVSEICAEVAKIPRFESSDPVEQTITVRDKPITGLLFSNS